MRHDHVPHSHSYAHSHPRSHAHVYAHSQVSSALSLGVIFSTLSGGVLLSLAADAEQRGIAKKMQAKTFAAYPNVDRPQVAIRMLAGGP